MSNSCNAEFIFAKNCRIPRTNLRNLQSKIVRKFASYGNPSHDHLKLKSNFFIPLMCKEETGLPKETRFVYKQRVFTRAQGQLYPGALC